ncbi:MAG: hypothetical protein ABJB74_02945 [Gemmatimonas sp.]
MTHVMLERLLRIDWRADDARLRSHVVLMREYLRRAAVWAKTLDCTEHWPFVDFATYVAPAVRAPQELVHELNGHLGTKPLNALMRETCVYALHWAALRDDDNATLVDKYSLADPYEPLIRLYERGGHFYTEHGFIYILHVGIPAAVNGWQFFDRPTSGVALNDDALQALD